MAARTAPPPQLLTIPETAALLGCCKVTVYAHIAAGELDVTDISTHGRSKSRVPETSVAAFIERRTSNAKRLRSAS